MPPRISGTLASNVKPMIRPVTSSTTTDSRLVTTSASVRPGEHRRARHRQRAEAVDQALVEVLVEPERRDEAAEGDVLDDDPGDQEVDVGVARRGDRAAEDVDEEQHEHHRLHREGDAAGRARAAGAPGCARRSPACRTPAASCRLLLVLVVVRLGRVAGERQEHVVQGGPPQAEVVDARRRPRRAGGPPRRSCRCAGGPVSLTVSSSATGGSSDIGASAPTAVSTAPVSARWTSRRSPPTRSLSSSGVPSAMTRPRSMTAMRSARRSASSRYCVVSSTVVPSATSSSIVAHSSRRLRGSRPVVGSSRKSTGGLATSAARQVEPPAHAARVGLDGAIGGVDEVEALEQLAARGAWPRRGARRRGARP